MRKLLLFLLLVCIQHGHSAVIEVDGISCELPDAVRAAAANAAIGGCTAGGFGTVTLNLAPQTIFSLSEADPVFSLFAIPIRSLNLIIEGNGSTIERADAAPQFGLLLIDNGSEVTLNNLTLRNGLNPMNFGGGIQVFGSSTQLTLNHVDVLDNVGGGIFIVGSLTPTPAEHTINNSRIADNSTLPFETDISGGVTAFATKLKINNTTIDHNTSLYQGGGLELRYSELIMTNSTISNNLAENSGGGISVTEAADNLVKIYGSTIVNNQSMASGGGLDLSMGGATPSNSYIQIYSSIISGNSAAVSANEINGPITQNILLNGYNLIGTEGDSGSVNVNLGPNDSAPIESIAAILSPLNDQPGFLRVHTLVDSSPAIDFAPSLCVSDFDQIGTARPQDGNNDGVFSCDAGAVEYVADLIFIASFD